MIKVTVLYPHHAGAKFDMDYYCDSHMPLCERVLKPALRGVAVDKGISDGAPGSPPVYVAIGHLLFDSINAYQTAFEANGDKIMADIANYTDIRPVIQISEVMID